jgi:hypothetical protein
MWPMAFTRDRCRLLSTLVRKYGQAPRTPMRPDGKARGAAHSGAYATDEQRSQPGCTPPGCIGVRMRSYLRIRVRRAVSLAVVALLASATQGFSQDSQYWSIQYGPVGQLVGGQLIGGVPDLSATFYNPGALALRNESSYLLSTESVQWEGISTAAPTSLAIFDTSSSTFGAAPSLLAGALPRWLGSNTRLAWSFLTRQKLDVRLGQRLTNPLGSPWETSAAESYFDQRVEEDWAGLTFSRPLSRSLGVGVTWYGVYRGQRTRKELSVQGIAGDGRSVAVSGVTDFDYTHYRTLAKLGLAWQTPEWNAGLSITTPSLGVLGSGNAAYTVSVAGPRTGADGNPLPPTLATGTSKGLDAEYRSSWAIGAGASRRLGATRLYASAEWYAPVGRFTVIALPNDSAEAPRLTQEFGAVLNGGIGFEQVVNDDVSLYGAFHTDFSASVGTAQGNVAVSDWDLYHLSGGVSFRIRSNRFTLGGSWAFGQTTRPLQSPIPPDSAPGSVLGSDVNIRYSKVTVLLGFEFGR